MTLCNLLLELLGRCPCALLDRRTSSLVGVGCRLRRSLGSLEGLHLTELIGRQSPARSTGSGSGPLSESGQMGSLLLRCRGRTIRRLLRGRSSSSLAKTRCGHVRCRGVRYGLRVRRWLSGGGRSGNVGEMLLRARGSENFSTSAAAEKKTQRNSRSAVRPFSLASLGTSPVASPAVREALARDTPGRVRTWPGSAPAACPVGTRRRRGETREQ